MIPLGPRFLPLLLVPLAFAAPLPQQASESRSSDPLVGEGDPIPGALVLAGPGALTPVVRTAFLDLARGGPVVVLAGESRGAASSPWNAAEGAGATHLRVGSPEDLLALSSLSLLLEAGGLWLEGVPEAVATEPMFRLLVRNLLERGGVAGGAGESARLLSGAGGEGLGLAPRLHLVFGANDTGNEDTHHHVAAENPGRVVAALPDGAALVLHDGRKLSVLGSGMIGFAIYRAGGELVDEQVFDGITARGIGGPLAAPLDLLAWRRRARLAELPAFPGADARRPSVPRGALIVQGGGRVSEETWERFVELAGGPRARFVCIPSASEQDSEAAPSSYSRGVLSERGCGNVAVVHVESRSRANRDGRLLAALRSADAVWIDGGRTFRFMDRFERTRAAEALADVLERGGVVGGSSAGCQVIGDLLVRGNPATNSELTHPSYLQGLGLLPGVVLDAHFRERKRGPELSRLVARYPSFLGIGVDAEAALLVQGTRGTVLGTGGVDVFDARGGGDPGEGFPVESGQSFDLATGEIDPPR